MATITKRGSRWFAQVRRKGFTCRYKSFETKTDAQTWARQQETMIDAGQGAGVIQSQKRLTLRDILTRYVAEVSPRKRGAASEILRLRKMQRSPLCDLAINAVSPAAIAAYRDERLAVAKPATVRRELATLRHALDTARKEWGIGFALNPAREVILPSGSDARNKRLQSGDLDRLMIAAEGTRNAAVKPIILLAISTGLRRGEILSLRWSNIDLERRVATIPITKTGLPRTIPLTDSAVEILMGVHRDSNIVFDIAANAFRKAWERLRVRAGIPDLRFHDLRHEAISRFCEMGLSIPEVGLISGHRDPRMLFRYAHLRPSDLATKLRGNNWSG